eukprot:3111612-Amphidinium_carterae.1
MEQNSEPLNGVRVHCPPTPPFQVRASLHADFVYLASDEHVALLLQHCFANTFAFLDFGCMWSAFSGYMWTNLIGTLGLETCVGAHGGVRMVVLSQPPCTERCPQHLV